MTIKLGIIGYPLSHSLSKVMQEAALKDLGLEGTYEIMEVEPEDLIDKIKEIKCQNFTGFNVTIPHKVPVTVFLDEVDPLADISGSANTVKILPDRSFKGYNTDIYGFTQGFSEKQKNRLKGKKAAILGTGGAARAVAIGLNVIGVKEIDFYSRNVINASSMVNFLRENFPQTVFGVKQIQSLSNLSDVSVLINATPIGMRGQSMDLSPVEEKVLKTMRVGSIVYDIIYNPRTTKLLETAKKLDLETIDGTDMLVHQGAKAFEIWTGEKPDAAIMKMALLDSLAKW